MPSRIHAQRISSENHRAEFQGRHHEVYQELTEVLMERYRRAPDAGDDARAFVVFERSKARAMAEGLVESRLNIQQDLEPELLQREQQASRKIAELQTRLIEAAKRQETTEEMAEAEQAWDRLRSLIKIERSPIYILK